MLVRKGHFFLAMTFAAVCFRLFFVHCQKLTMLFIVRQVGSGFWRRIPENKKNAAADRDKDYIIQEDFLFCHKQSRMV